MGISYDQYAEQVPKVLDRHVVGVAVKEPGGVYEVALMGQRQFPDEWSEEKTRKKLLPMMFKEC